MPMRDYENLKDITIPQRQEAIMNIFCDSWQECCESSCTNCSDRPKKPTSLMECFSLKCSRKLIEAGYATVVRCKDCKHFMEYSKEYKQKIEGANGDCYFRVMCSADEQFNGVTYNDFCSYGERKEE